MSSFVWKDGRWRDKKTGEPMETPDTNEVCVPRLWRDIPEYRSPIDGRIISSRSTRREDLKRNDCIEIDPRPKEKRGYRNPNFALKRGLPLREDALSR